MLKNLRLAQQAAQASGAVKPLGAQAAQLYGLFAALRQQDTDFCGISNFLRGDAG